MSTLQPTPQRNPGWQQQKQQQQLVSSVHKPNLSDRDRCLQLEAKLAGEQNKVRKLTAELKTARETGGFEDENSPLPTLAQQATFAHSPGLEAKLVDMMKERDCAIAEKKTALGSIADAVSARESAQSAQASAEARLVEALASRDAASASAAASEARANALVREAAAAAAEKSKTSSKSDNRVKALEAALAKSNDANEVAIADLAEARKTLVETKEALSAAEAAVAEQAEVLAVHNEESLLLSAALEGRDKEVQRMRSRVRVLEEQAADSAALTETINHTQSKETIQEQETSSGVESMQQSGSCDLNLFQATDAPFEATEAEPALSVEEATDFEATTTPAVEAQATDAHEGLEAIASEDSPDNDEDHSPLVLGAAAVALAAAAGEEEASNSGGGHSGKGGRRRSMRLQRMSVVPSPPPSPLAEDEAIAADELNEEAEAIPQLSIEAALAMTDNVAALPETVAPSDHKETVLSEPELAPNDDGNGIGQEENIQPIEGDPFPKDMPSTSVSLPAVEKEEGAPKVAAAAQKARAKKAKGRRRRSGVFGDFPKSAGNKKSLLSDNLLLNDEAGEEEANPPPPPLASEDLDPGDDWNVGVLHWGHELASSSAVAHDDDNSTETHGVMNVMASNTADSHPSEAAHASTGQEAGGGAADFFSPCKGAPPPSPGVALSPAAQPACKNTQNSSPALMAPSHDVDEEEQGAGEVAQQSNAAVTSVASPTVASDDVREADETSAHATVPLSALTADSLASALATFLSSSASSEASPVPSTASNLSMAAACAMVDDNGDAATALAPFVAAAAAAETQVAKGCANTTVSSTVAVAGKRRVQFASHDFSAVAPPVDTLESSDLEAEACVDALAAVMTAKQQLVQAQEGSRLSLLQRVSSALVAVACALRADANASEESSGEVSDKESLRMVLDNACSERGFSVKHLAANAELLAAELRCSDVGNDDSDCTISVSTTAVGPLRSRLMELASGQVRFHLRRLLNAPPPPATTPCHTQNTSESYSESGCRSNAHKLFTFDEPPLEAPPVAKAATAAAATKHENECPFAEGAVASVVTHALEAMHWAHHADGSSDEPDAASLTANFTSTFADFPSQDLSVAMSTVHRAHAAAAGARGAAFLHALLEWPGLQEAVAQHGGWTQVEKFASYLKACGSCGGQGSSVESLNAMHLAPLSDMAQLRSSVAPGGHWHAMTTALQPLRASLFHLKQSHAVAIVNAFADDDANKPDHSRHGTGNDATGTTTAGGGRTTSGRRKRQGKSGNHGDLPRCLLIALGEEAVPFPGLAYVSPVRVWAVGAGNESITGVGLNIAFRRFVCSTF